MIDLFDPANFDFFARFFLAGFILYSVRTRYVLGEKPKASEVVFESVILSLINQLVFMVLSALGALVPDQVTAFLSALTGGKAAFFAEVLILPALLGIAIGVTLGKGWNSAILSRLAMPIVHPTRRACDFAFGDVPGDRFVIVTTADGTHVFGRSGEKSLAASDSDVATSSLSAYIPKRAGTGPRRRRRKTPARLLSDQRNKSWFSVS